MGEVIGKGAGSASRAPIRNSRKCVFDRFRTWRRSSAMPENAIFPAVVHAMFTLQRAQKL
jgi:hypothetical protein